jgi:hypothetical protein
MLEQAGIEFKAPAEDESHLRVVVNSKKAIE